MPDCNYSKEEIEDLISGKEWFHKISLPHDIETPGAYPRNSLYVDRHNVPKDLSGLRVLNVRARDGYWSFEALKRGAKEVVSIDDFSDAPDGYDWSNFDNCRKILGYDENICIRESLKAHEIKQFHFGMFDLILFFDAFNRTRHPLLTLDKISEVGSGAIFIEAACCNNFSPYKPGGYPGEMVMEFYPEGQLGNDPTNWWSITGLALCHAVKQSGFTENIAGLFLNNQPVGHHDSRLFVQGYKPGSRLPERFQS